MNSPCRDVGSLRVLSIRVELSILVLCLVVICGHWAVPSGSVELSCLVPTSHAHPHTSTHMPTLTHPPTHTPTLTHPLTCPPSHTHSHAHPHTPTHMPTLTHPLTCPPSHTHSHAHPHTPTHMPTLTHPLTRPPSHTRPHRSYHLLAVAAKELYIMQLIPLAE